jgi:hypothetical protein
VRCVSASRDDSRVHAHMGPKRGPRNRSLFMSTCLEGNKFRRMAKRVPGSSAALAGLGIRPQSIAATGGGELSRVARYVDRPRRPVLIAEGSLSRARLLVPRPASGERSMRAGGAARTAD